MFISIDSVMAFLEDEGLNHPHNKKIKDDYHWQININEPWQKDTKMRCGIVSKTDKNGNHVILFNSFKSVATLGDDYKGDFFKFISLVKDIPYFEAKEYFSLNYIIKNQNIKDTLTKHEEKSQHNDVEVFYMLPESFEFLDVDSKNHFPYLRYLYERKIDFTNLDKYRLYVDQSQKRIIFPTFENEKMIYYSGRSIKDNKILPWLHSQIKDTYPIWGLDFNYNETCYIFEAIFDAAMIDGGIATLGAGKFSDVIMRKILDKNFYKVVVVMDNDVAGIKSKYHIAEKISNIHNNVWIYDFKDIEQKDFNQMAVEKIDFQMEKRLYRWNTKTQALIKMGYIH